MGILDMLTQLASSGSVSDQHFDQATQSVPKDVLGAALANTFRSDSTAPIGDLVGQLFGNSNAQQQAGLLNQILATVGPTAASALAGGVLGRVLSPGSSQVTPEQASQITPEQVQTVVNHAHESTPGLADQLGSFYAEHSGLIKTLGGAALLVAMTHMKDHLGASKE
jgi:hypothetical protein